MTDPAIHLIDDEEPVRDALGFLLGSHGLRFNAYASGPEFLDRMALSTLRGCIVLDVRMEPMSGLQLQDELIARGNELPILFLSGHGDIPMAVDALQKGAFDFVEKPVNADAFIKRIDRALALEASNYAARSETDLDRKRMLSLTDREHAVMRLVAGGKLNKVIADELCVSVRTVEVHRARGFTKLGVRSAAEAATLLARFQGLGL
jgi:two-component system response regulator DctR